MRRKSPVPSSTSSLLSSASRKAAAKTEWPCPPPVDHGLESARGQHDAGALARHPAGVLALLGLDPDAAGERARITAVRDDHDVLRVHRAQRVRDVRVRDPVRGVVLTRIHGQPVATLGLLGRTSRVRRSRSAGCRCRPAAGAGWPGWKGSPIAWRFEASSPRSRRNLPARSRSRSHRIPPSAAYPGPRRRRCRSPARGTGRCRGADPAGARPSVGSRRRAPGRRSRTARRREARRVSPAWTRAQSSRVGATVSEKPRRPRSSSRPADQRCLCAAGRRVDRDEGDATRGRLTQQRRVGFRERSLLGESRHLGAAAPNARRRDRGTQQLLGLPHLGEAAIPIARGDRLVGGPGRPDLPDTIAALGGYEAASSRRGEPSPRSAGRADVDRAPRGPRRRSRPGSPSRAGPHRPHAFPKPSPWATRRRPADCRSGRSRCASEDHWPARRGAEVANRAAARSDCRGRALCRPPSRPARPRASSRPPSLRSSELRPESPLLASLRSAVVWSSTSGFGARVDAQEASTRQRIAATATATGTPQTRDPAGFDLNQAAMDHGEQCYSRSQAEATVHRARRR